MRDFTLYDLYGRNGRNLANETALVFGEVRMSFAELLAECDKLTDRLTLEGQIHGQRIALLAMNHPGFFTLYGALAKAGAILVPLNWRLSDDELLYILKDSDPLILYSDRHYAERAQTLAAGAGIAVGQLDNLMESPIPAGNGSQPVEVKGDDAACIIYTAAVEGVPRGAVLSHTNLISANLQVIGSMGLSPEDVNLAMLPLFHITGMNLALATMHLGGKNVVMEKFSETETLQLTDRENVSLWASFPPILQRMTEAIDNPETIDSVRYVVGLDGPDNITAFEEATNAKFWMLYGQSETSGFVTLSQASDKLGTAGKQGPLSSFMLVDEQDNEVGDGQTGEIVVRGPLVFQGYWKQDEANAYTFRNGWHHTGDLGLLDEEGFLVYKGRKPEKELIKPGGENVYPAEVEAVIMQHPEIEAVSVIGVPDPKFGEGVKAVCVRSAGSALSAEELIEFVGGRIARYKKPGYVQFVENLPMANDTIDRIKVKELYG